MVKVIFKTESIDAFILTSHRLQLFCKIFSEKLSIFEECRSVDLFRLPLSFAYISYCIHFSNVFALQYHLKRCNNSSYWTISSQQIKYTKHVVNTALNFTDCRDRINWEHWWIWLQIWNLVSTSTSASDARSIRSSKSLSRRQAGMGRGNKRSFVEASVKKQR